MEDGCHNPLASIPSASAAADPIASNFTDRLSAISSTSRFCAPNAV